MTAFTDQYSLPNNFFDIGPWNEIKKHYDIPTKSEVEQNKNPELQLDQHVTAWTASWVNVNHWAHN
jgi:hypothetical protein